MPSCPLVPLVPRSPVSALVQATKTHDKRIAIVRMARTRRIFLLDFITNLAKTYCRASKISKKYNKCIPATINLIIGLFSLIISSFLRYVNILRI